jgi:hypothetical protein
MIAKDLILGVTPKGLIPRKTCLSCIKGKAKALTTPARTKPRSSKILELVHSDVRGPIRSITSTEDKYMVTFIDDYSHFTVIYLIDPKGQCRTST